LEVLILNDFKSLFPEVLIPGDFKSLAPEVLILVDFKPFRMNELRKLGKYVEVLIPGGIMATTDELSSISYIFQHSTNNTNKSTGSYWVFEYFG
jgi:hypothetical protein